MSVSNSIPAAPGALPFLGHLVPLLRDPLAFLQALPESGDLVRIRLGLSEVLVVCDPMMSHQVLRNDRIFDKGGPLVDRLRVLFGEGLGIVSHDGHRPRRRLLQPAFHSARLPSYAPVMTAQITEVTDAWRTGQLIDVLRQMQTITSRTLLATMFSDTYLSGSTTERLLEDLETFLRGTYRRMVMPQLLGRLPTMEARRYRRAHARLLSAMASIVADRRASASAHTDLLSRIMEAYDTGTSDALGEDEITHEVINFFGAGTESPAATIAWALSLLGQHPDIERRLHTEVDTVLQGRTPAYADLPQLELAGAIITETLRIRPPVWLLTRVATADTRLGPHLVPAGSNIAVSPYMMHHRPDLYSDPEIFDPDRWQRDAPPAPGALIPFGSGARKCIGDDYGIAETTLILATIVSRWRLTHLPGRQPRAAVATTLRPHKLTMRAAARSANAQPSGNSSNDIRTDAEVSP
ncbi:cytochrome P450 [Nocardia sp. NPDC004750]